MTIRLRQKLQPDRRRRRRQNLTQRGHVPPGRDILLFERHLCGRPQ